jgi:hypothetical protein
LDRFGFKPLAMKEIILQQLSNLIESEDAEEKNRLRMQLVTLIGSAKLDLANDNEVHTKRLIIATINNYMDTGDTALKKALLEHYKALDLLLGK